LASHVHYHDCHYHDCGNTATIYLQRKIDMSLTEHTIPKSLFELNNYEWGQLAPVHVHAKLQLLTRRGGLLFEESNNTPLDVPFKKDEIVIIQRELEKEKKRLYGEELFLENALFREECIRLLELKGFQASWSHIAAVDIDTEVEYEAASKANTCHLFPFVTMDVHPLLLQESLSNTYNIQNCWLALTLKW
jgi:hypothetical protein